MIKKLWCKIFGHKFRVQGKDLAGGYHQCIRCGLKSYFYILDQGSTVNTFDGIKRTTNPIWFNSKAKENGDE